MKKNRIQIKKLEDYNKEFIKLYHSKSIRFRRNITKLKNCSLNYCIKLVKRKLYAKIGDIKIKIKTKTRDKQEFYYNFGNELNDTKVIVYACITNNYDVIKDPLYINDDTKYYLYKDDNTSNHSEIWKSKEIDYRKSLTNANRYYKFHPDIFEKEAEFAIYIDGTVKIISDVTTICSIARESKIGIAMHRHHVRDCVYQEAIACHCYGRGNKIKIDSLMKTYKNEGFPQKFGLCEATIIVYDLKNPLAKKIAHEWWENYMKSETKRDQLIFPYILWKNGFTMNDVGNLGNDLWNNPKFLIHGHE